MQLLLDVQPEKLTFVLELVQQLDGVTIVRLKNDQLPQIAQQLTRPPSETQANVKNDLSGQVSDLQSELDDLFG